MLRDMLDQFVFDLCWPGHKHRPRVRNGLSYMLKVVMVLCCMPAANAIGLVVDMPGRAMRMQQTLIGLCNVEMEDASFEVIDPDDRVKVA